MSEFLEAALTERIRALVPDGEGDWLDVRRRAALAARRRSRRAAFALAAAAFLALLVALPALGLGVRLLRLLSLEPSDKLVPALRGEPASVPYVVEDKLYEPGREAIKLAVRPRAPLLGGDAPLAVPSPDGTLVAYETWQGGAPRLRLFERASGNDLALEPGSESVAWRADGALAYWQASSPDRPARPYPGVIVVRPAARGAPAVWARGRNAILVSGWAGRHLLVTVSACPACRRASLPGVLSLEAPRRARRLPLRGVTAISPDGRFAIGGAEHAPGLGEPSSLVRVVEVASARVVASFELSNAAPAGAPARWLAGGLGLGSWAGSRIVAVTAFENVGALVVLRFRGGKLTLERVLRLGGAALLPAGHGPFFSAPLALDRAASRVAVAVSVPARNGGPYFRSFLVCELGRGRCLRGRPLPRGGSIGLVFDPSRPRRTG